MSVIIRSLLVATITTVPAQACSAQRTLDEKTMAAITASCGLKGSRFLRKGGQTFIDVHHKDRDDRKIACMTREIERRKLASGLHFGHLGDDRPPLTQEQQRCVNELMAKHGLDAVDQLEAKCGPR
jgi:hypothetical protein